MENKTEIKVELEGKENVNIPVSTYPGVAVSSRRAGCIHTQTASLPREEPLLKEAFGGCKGAASLHSILLAGGVEYLSKA